jgi:hypothetical protein
MVNYHCSFSAARADAWEHFGEIQRLPSSHPLADFGYEFVVTAPNPAGAPNARPRMIPETFYPDSSEASLPVQRESA